MSFDLRQIRALCAVTRHGGFSKASREVGISQPTLSTHIRNLEKELGTRLLDRAGRTVTLTPAGAIFVDYADRILDLCGQANQAVNAFMGKVRGEVAIASSTVPGEYLLPQLLSSFSRLFPEVRVNLAVGDSRSVMEQVSDGRAALGLAGMETSHPSLQSRLFRKDRIVLVAGPELVERNRISHIVNEMDLQHLPLIRREHGSGTQMAVDAALRTSNINPDNLLWIATLGSTRSVLEGTISGMGGAFLSRITVERELGSGTLRELQTPWIEITRGFFIVTHRSRSIPPAAQCLLETLLGRSVENAGGVLK